jgi:Recombination endonuclease VII
MDSKFCRDCGAERPISEFTRNRNSRDGYAFYCREHSRKRHQSSRDRRTGGPRKRHPRGLTVPDGHKWCPDCGEIKPLSGFGRNAAAKSGVTSYCKPCHNTRGKKAKELVGGERTYHLRRRYGITAEEADLILDRQVGVCAICRVAPAAHVDHDHRTGAVRALLCFNCNGGLGQFRDDPILLRFAAAYVELHRERQIADRERALAEALAKAERPEDGPPVGSQRDPEQPRGDRVTGRRSGSRRRKTAGEVDG